MDHVTIPFYQKTSQSLLSPEALTEMMFESVAGRTGGRNEVTLADLTLLLRTPERYSSSESSPERRSPKKRHPHPVKKALYTIMPTPPSYHAIPSTHTATTTTPTIRTPTSDRRPSIPLNSPTPSIPSTHTANTPMPNIRTPTSRLPSIPLYSPTTTLTHTSTRPSPVASGTAGLPSHYQARDEQLFTMMHKIVHELQIQREMLERALRHQASEAPVTELPQDITFPLATVAEVDRLETTLADRDTYNSVVHHLAVVGGRTVKECVTRLLKATFTSSLAEKYNFLGKKGKLPFGKLKMSSLLYKCLQRNTATKTATFKDMELVTKEWLRSAKDRDGGRKRRASVDAPSIPSGSPPPPSDSE